MRGHPGWVLKDEWELAEEVGGGVRGSRPGAFQAEGTACPRAQKRESLHRVVFGFVGAENVREESQIRQAQSPGILWREVMCAELMRGHLSCRREGAGDWEGRIREKCEMHLQGFPPQGLYVSDHIPQLFPLNGGPVLKFSKLKLLVFCHLLE